MYSKLLFTLTIFVTTFFSFNPESNCADAYTSASYALSHSKKAFKAHNFDHQKYYAGRALEALEKTRDLVGECSCNGALETIEDGIENLEDAMDPVDWKMGRYYTKRAMENTYGVLENLDICSTDGQTSEKSKGTPGNKSITNNTVEVDSSPTEDDQALGEFEQAAEQHLAKLNEKLSELCLLMGCESTEFVLDQVKIEKMEKRSFNSIEDAQLFYRVKAIKACQQAVSALEKCGVMQ